MFDGATRIDESRADCANFRALHILSHDREPVRIDRFHVVFEKKKPWAVGVRDGMVFRRGIIHRVCEIQNAMREICGASAILSP